MFSIDFERLELSSAAFIEFTEEFNELQAVRMHIGSESVDADIYRMTDNEHYDENDHADEAVAEYRAYKIKNLSDDTGRHAESQQTAVGEDIAQISRCAVKTVDAL